MSIKKKKKKWRLVIYLNKFTILFKPSIVPTFISYIITKSLCRTLNECIWTTSIQFKQNKIN